MQGESPPVTGEPGADSSLEAAPRNTGRTSARPPNTRRASVGRAPLIATSVALGAMLALAVVRHAPSAPVGPEADPTGFSSARAYGVLARMSGAPRPLGSPANEAARAMLLGAFTQLGWQAQTQRAFVCGAEGICGFVENVVATLEGTEPQADWVAIAAHYDSVPASPGASDDGLGVASVLEVARALSAGGRPRRTAIALLTDGEEDGLLGAEAFVRFHPFARRVGNVLNSDARGNRGPSLLFETSAPNVVIPLAAAHVKHPNTSSVFYEVYRRLPNRTDFTVLGSLGPGASLANVSGIEAYHSAIDIAARVDRGTLQHHGDQLLALTRAFAEQRSPPGREIRPERMVWFDVFSFFIARWPESWSVPIAVSALSLLGLGTLLCRGWAMGGLVAILVLITAGAGGVIASIALRAAGALASPWVAEPLAACIAVHAAAVACGAGALSLIARARSLGAPGLYAGAWLCFGGIGLASALIAPGASYLFTIPVLVAALAAVVPFPSLGLGCALPVLAGGALWLPLGTGVYETLGCGPVLAAPTVLLLASATPLLLPWGRALALGAAAVWLAASAAAVTRPNFSSDHPQRINVMHRQDDRGAALAVIDHTWGPLEDGPLPESMRAVLTNSGTPGKPARLGELSVFPGSRASIAVAGDRVDLPGPELSVVVDRNEASRRALRLRLRSPRGAPTLLLGLPPDPAIRVASHGFEIKDRVPFMESAIAFRGVPAGGIEVELQTPQGKPLELILFDISRGLPANSLAARAASARPPHAAAFQEGDITVLLQHSRL
jgi:hypothetical protein